MAESENNTSPQNKDISKKTFVSSDENFTPFYPSAESYEAENQNIELQIRALKNTVSRQLEDDLYRLQYELNEREYRIRLREAELAKEQAEVRQLKELYIKRLAELEEQPSPKELPSTKEQEQQEFVSEKEEKISSEGNFDKRQLGNNPKGVGGLPGTKNSEAVSINRNKYQGQSVPLGDGSTLEWDDQNKEYNLISANQGLKFTFFAVEAAYLEDNFINPNYPQFYSQTILGKQVWYERPLHGKKTDELELRYAGRVPFEELMNKLNGQVNSAHMQPNGDIVENQDFRRAYKNWRYTYQTGTFFKNAQNDLYQILEVNESDSKGNPPAFRTDGNFKSKTYDQQKKTSKSERAKWAGKVSGRKTKGRNP